MSALNTANLVSDLGCGYATSNGVHLTTDEAFELARKVNEGDAEMERQLCELNDLYNTADAELETAGYERDEAVGHLDNLQERIAYIVDELKAERGTEWAIVELEKLLDL